MWTGPRKTRLKKLPRCDNPVHVDGTLEIVHVRETIEIIPQRHGTPVPAIERYFHRNGKSGEAALRPRGIESYSVFADAVMGVRPISHGADRRNKNTVLVHDLTLAPDGHGGKQMGIFLLIQGFHTVCLLAGKHGSDLYLPEGTSQFKPSMEEGNNTTNPSFFMNKGKVLCYLSDFFVKKIFFQKNPYQKNFVKGPLGCSRPAKEACIPPAYIA